MAWLYQPLLPSAGQLFAVPPVTQNLTQSVIFDDSVDTFYTHTILYAPQDITQTLIFDDSVDTYYIHTFVMNLDANIFVNTNQFYTHEISVSSFTIDLYAPLLDDSVDTFYTHETNLVSTTRRVLIT